MASKYCVNDNLLDTHRRSRTLEHDQTEQRLRMGKRFADFE